MKNNASLIYGFFLVVGDFLALVAAFASAYLLRVKLDDRPIHTSSFSGEDYIITLLFLIPFFLIIFGLLGLYNKNVYDNRFSEFGRLLTGSFVGMLFLISYGYAIEDTVFPTRLITFYSLILSFLFVLLFRTISRALKRISFGFGYGVSNVLLVGDTPVTQEFIDSLRSTKITGYKIVGIVGDRSVGKDFRHFGSFADAIKVLEKDGVHAIIQTELFSAKDKNSEVLSYAQENHVAYRFVPGNNDLFSGNIEVDLFAGVPVVAVHQTALVGWGRIVKRLFDLVVSLVSLVLVSPVLLLVAILTKLFDLRGSVFFKQTRLTRFNQEFTVYKFRSQYAKYDGTTPEQAFEMMGKPELAKKYRDNGDYLSNDPRVTPFGKFIRATSLDELPQLFNVLRGDISLVGPRALIPEEIKKFSRRHTILSVKSGLTGLAVISGRRDIPFEERRQLDLYYVQNWSFWNDIVIIAKTAAIVLLGRGAK